MGDPFPQLAAVFPTDVVNRSSSAQELRVAKATLRAVANVSGGGGYLKWAPAAARLVDKSSPDAQRLLDALLDNPPQFEDASRNGLGYKGCGPSMECVGGSEAITTLLLQSQDGVIRLFPVMPPPASFVTLRARGAFLVTATLDAVAPTSAASNISVGVVREPVRIQSEAGSPCRFVNPWHPSSFSPVVRKVSGGD